MTEGILIEIASRRWKLEEAIEALHPDADFIDPDENYDMPAREQLTALAEVCRTDFEAMVEFIRKVRG